MLRVLMSYEMEEDKNSIQFYDYENQELYGTLLDKLPRNINGGIGGILSNDKIKEIIEFLQAHLDSQIKCCKAQQKKFYVLEKQGKLPKGTAEKWEKETPNLKKLPSKVRRKK